MATCFYFSCKKEKEVLIEPQLIISSDTLVFNGSQIKDFIISTKPASVCEYQITSYPNWLKVSSKSGIINNNLVNIQITSDFSGLAPGTYEGKIEIMSTSGNKTVYVKGLVGDQLGYSLPDSLIFSLFGVSQGITIKNEGNIPLNYSITTSNNFISSSISSGNVSVGQQSNIVFLVNRNAMLTGKFTSQIYLNINNKLDTINVRIENLREQKIILSTDVIDAEYSKSKDILVYVSSKPSKIHIFQPTVGTTSIISLDLDYIPTCVSVSSDGATAVVGHDGHITYVDLNTKAILRSYSVSCNAFDIVLGKNKWAYVFPKSDQWTDIRCVDVDLANDNEVLHTGGSIYAGTKAKLHPSGEYIYGANNGLSPSDLEKYNIQNGRAQLLYDSPYHGTYPISGDLWFSESGDRVFTRGKTVLKTSEVESNDMLYNGTIALETTSHQIMWLDHSSNKSNLYIVASGDDYLNIKNKPYIYVHNASNLTYKSKFELEKYLVPDNNGSGMFYTPEPHYVFSNSTGSNLFVLTKAIGSGLENEWAIQTIKIN